LTINGTYTKQEILQKATQWVLTNRRGQPLSAQAIGIVLIANAKLLHVDDDKVRTISQRGQLRTTSGLDLRLNHNEGWPANRSSFGAGEVHLHHERRFVDQTGASWIDGFQ